MNLSDVISFNAALSSGSSILLVWLVYTVQDMKVKQRTISKMVTNMYGRVNHLLGKDGQPPMEGE